MSGRTIGLGCFTAMGRHSPIVFSKRALKLQHTEINGLKELMFRKGKVQRKPLSQVALAMDSTDISIDSPLPSKAIMQFYTSINDKNLKQLEKLLSDDCFFDDYSFPKPFQGKQVHFRTSIYRRINLRFSQLSNKLLQINAGGN